MINEIVSLDKQAGTDLSGVDDIGNVLERGGLDFNVEKVPMFTPEGNKVNNKYLIRRTDSNFVLGTCGKRYTTVDNSTMFAPFDSVVSRCGATYENAGTVGHGKTCWVSAKMPKEFHVETPNGRDEYNQRVIMLVYHDGLRRNVYFTFNNRVICNNMLGSLQNRSRGSRGHGVRHTPTWEANLGQAEEAFQASIESANTFIVNANKLAKLPMRKKEAEQFAKEFVRDFKIDKKKETDRSDRSKTILDNRVDNVMTLFSEGMGNSGRTRYDMLNAVTEYLDHHTGRKDVKWAPSKFLSNLQGNQGSTKRRVVAELLKAA